MCVDNINRIWWPVATKNQKKIADEMEYDQQIDDNPAILYDQAVSAEEW